MPYIIKNSGKLQEINPSGDYLTIDDIKEITGGWFTPDKIGPIWLIIPENVTKSKETYNIYASIFFMRDIYETPLVLTTYDLDPELNLFDNEDRHFTKTEIETSFKNMYDNFINNLDNPEISEPKKVEYFFRPDQINIETAKKPDEYRYFLTQSYNFIIESYDKKSKMMTMLEDENSIIRIETKEEQISAINQIIKALEENEEYEKCAKLSSIKSEIEKEIETKI